MFNMKKIRVLNNKVDMLSSRITALEKKEVVADKKKDEDKKPIYTVESVYAGD